MTVDARTRISLGTSRRLCRHVAERWNQQYGDAPTNPQHAEIQRRLWALNKKGTRDEIDAIIGNSTWTTEMCDVCERRVEVWVTLDATEYESGTSVCRDCLEDALAEIDS